MGASLKVHDFNWEVKLQEIFFSSTVDSYKFCLRAIASKIFQKNYHFLMLPSLAISWYYPLWPFLGTRLKIRDLCECMGSKVARNLLLFVISWCFLLLPLVKPQLKIQEFYWDVKLQVIFIFSTVDSFKFLLGAIVLEIFRTVTLLTFLPLAISGKKVKDAKRFSRNENLQEIV